MSNSLSSRAIGANEAEARLPESQRERSIALFHHGTLTVKLYAPRGNDPQSPHTRDEIYVSIPMIRCFTYENRVKNTLKRS